LALTLVSWRVREQPMDFREAGKKGDIPALREAAERGQLSKTAAQLALTGASFTGQTAAALFLLDHGAEVDATDTDGLTPLCRAVEGGQTAMIRWLAARGADLNREGERTRQTPLFVAAVYNQPESAATLLDLGAKTEVISSQGDVPIVIAVHEKHPQVVKVLLRHKALPDPKLWTSAETPLIIAADLGEIESVRLLLAAGADPNRSFASRRENPLMRASILGHIEIVKLLLAAGADPSWTSAVGETPLMRAAYGGRLAIVDLLLAAGVDVNHKSEDGETALTKAAQRNEKEMMARLIAAGADAAVKDGSGKSVVDLQQGYQAAEEKRKRQAEQAQREASRIQSPDLPFTFELPKGLYSFSQYGVVEATETYPRVLLAMTTGERVALARDIRFFFQIRPTDLTDSGQPSQTWTLPWKSQQLTVLRQPGMVWGREWIVQSVDLPLPSQPVRLYVQSPSDREPEAKSYLQQIVGTLEPRPDWRPNWRTEGVRSTEPKVAALPRLKNPLLLVVLAGGTVFLAVVLLRWLQGRS